MAKLSCNSLHRKAGHHGLAGESVTNFCKRDCGLYPGSPLALEKLATDAARIPRLPIKIDEQVFVSFATINQACEELYTLV